MIRNRGSEEEDVADHALTVFVIVGNRIHQFPIECNGACSTAVQSIEFVASKGTQYLCKDGDGWCIQDRPRAFAVTII